MKELDKIDLQILTLLGKQGRISVKEMAKEIYLSAPALANRIERLEKEKIITGYHAEINPQEFGYTIKAFVNLQVEPEQRQEFYSFIESVPNVIQCCRVTGDYSMLIEVLFRYTEELDHFVNSLQRFGHTRTQIAFSTRIEHRNIPLG